jgi:YfiH family protein
MPVTFRSTEAEAGAGIAVRRVAEVQDGGEIPLWRNPEWTERFQWLVQGTTASGSRPGTLDFGLFGDGPVGLAIDRWRRLREVTGFPTAVHSRQVHGAGVAEWAGGLPPGLVVTEGEDAHITASGGILATVSVADCVPVFLVRERSRVAGIAHAGWRGVAAGVIEAALKTLAPGGDVTDVRIHCGPSICGECYEVGPEVFRAVRPDVPPPDENRPIDLVAAIGMRATSAGIAPDRITASRHCTLCGEGSFFSHRGGSKGRQLGVIGLRP